MNVLIPPYWISQRTREVGKTRVVIVDTNVLLHNLDVLEHGSVAIANLVIPQTALQECRHRSFTSYNRVMDLLKSSTSVEDDDDNGGDDKKKKRCAIFFPDTHHLSTQIDPSTASASSSSSSSATMKEGEKNTINDDNDARIRNVAFHYGEALSGSDVDVILLTDDKGCRALALEEQQDTMDMDMDMEEEDEMEIDSTGNTNKNGKTKEEIKLLYRPLSVRAYITELEQENPELSLSDVVAQFGTSNASSKNQSTKENVYTPHLHQHMLSLGVKSGEYFQGHIRAERGTCDKCYVTVRQGEDRVAVSIVGSQDINRAVDGDVVAIALNSVDQWVDDAADDKDSKKNDDKKKEVAGIAADTAEPSIRDESNVMDTIDDGMSMRKPTGRVVGIVRRNFRKNYCGSIYTIKGKNKKKSQSKGKKKDKEETEVSERDLIAQTHEIEHPDGLTTTCVFFAVDPRIPPVLVRTTQRERLLGKRILIAIDSWPADSHYPLGHYVKTMGETGSKDVETEVLLHEHNIPCAPFPAKVLACLPPEDYKIELEEGRLDLRGLPVLSIDPPGCKDIDDALHCIVLPNGNYQAGVHIADVTHYVKAGTPIDLEAANRSTSTYLVNKRLDMLPSLLTTDLCSLKGNVDRFAFSVLWEVTPDAEIINVEFKKSIIHSIAALTYQQAQGMIDQPDDDEDIQAGAVKRLASLARKFRAKRIAAGALTLASPEVKFVLDSESLNPTDVQSYQLFEANALVEEFMLLANVTVGKKVLRHYPTLAVLRRHPAPNRAMFDGLISKAKCKGFAINIEDSKRLADSLDEAVVEDDPYFNKLLRILSTRCMSPAQYFCSGEYKPTDWHHYGLAAPVYTHFTSPIRRYADVCVHRLLAAAIGVESLPVHLSSKSHLHDLAANMNRRHRSAQLAGRASVQLHTLIVFSGDNGEKEENAYVLDVDTNESAEPSFTVIVPRYGIEGRVRLSHLAADDRNIRRDSDKHSIGYKDTTIRVFDQVRVKIYVNVVQETQKELMLDLVHPVFGDQPQVSNGASADATAAPNDTSKSPKSNTKLPKRKVEQSKSGSARKSRRKGRN